MIVSDMMSFGEYSFWMRAGKRMIISTRMSDPELPTGFLYKPETLKIRPSRIFYNKGTVSFEIVGWTDNLEDDNAK